MQRRMGIEYGVSIVEVARGMTVFAQQGKDAAQVIQLTGITGPQRQIQRLNSPSNRSVNGSNKTV